jgi:hypothetical protein
MKTNTKFIAQVLVFCATIFIPCNACSAQEPDAKRFVYNFYLWYGNESLKNTPGIPLFEDKIYEYVSQCTVDRLRIEYKRKMIGSDYFLKGNDFWPELLDTMTVEEEIPLSENVSIVPLVFHTGQNRQHVIAVFLKKRNNALAIIKIEDSRHHF